MKKYKNGLVKVLSLWLILMGIPFVVSCSTEEFAVFKKDDKGIVVSLPYIWKTLRHEGAFYRHSNDSYVTLSYHYKGNVLIGTNSKKEGPSLSMIDSENGKTVWKWNDILKPSYVGGDFIVFGGYQKDNLFLYQSDNSSYCIDLNNGSTKWKIDRRLHFASPIRGFDRTFFLYGDTKSIFPRYDKFIPYKGDIDTGVIGKYIIPEFDLNQAYEGELFGTNVEESCMLDGVRHLITFRVKNAKLNNGNYAIQSYLSLYNYETDQWVYRNKIMMEPSLFGGVHGRSLIHQGRVYTNIDRRILCHDIATGEQIWVRDFPRDFFSFNPVVSGDMMIDNCGDGKTYALDLRSGYLRWATGKTTGDETHSGRISYLNGVIYFVGGSSGILYAIEADTGKMLWEINSNNIEKVARFDSTMFDWGQAVHALPATWHTPARVIVTTRRYIYCFKAFK